MRESYFIFIPFCSVFLCCAAFRPQSDQGSALPRAALAVGVLHSSAAFCHNLCATRRPGAAIVWCALLWLNAAVCGGVPWIAGVFSFPKLHTPCWLGTWFQVLLPVLSQWNPVVAPAVDCISFATPHVDFFLLCTIQTTACAAHQHCSTSLWRALPPGTSFWFPPKNGSSFQLKWTAALTK